MLALTLIIVCHNFFQDIRTQFMFRNSHHPLLYMFSLSKLKRILYMNSIRINMPWSDEAVHREWTTNSTALSNHCVNTPHQYSPGQETTVDKSGLCVCVRTRVHVVTIRIMRQINMVPSAIKVLWLIYQRPKSKTTCKSRAHVSGIFQFSSKRMRTLNLHIYTRSRALVVGCTWWQIQQAVDIGTQNKPFRLRSSLIIVGIDKIT